jgi:hypothetical protein
MPVPPYTIHSQPSSSGTVRAGQHPPPTHSGTSGVYVGSYDPVLLTYQSLGGPDMISSQGDNQHPMPGWHSILGLHPTKTLYPRISSSHMHLPQVPLVGDAQVATPRQDLSNNSS